jgi:hypothetical protein
MSDRKMEMNAGSLIFLSYIFLLLRSFEIELSKARG